MLENQDQGAERGGRADVAQAIAREVNAAVASFLRRYGWRGVREGDLRGKAWEIALDAALTYTLDRGAPGPYFGRSIYMGLTSSLLFEGAPVSASWHARKNLVGVFAAPLDRVQEPQRSVLAQGVRERTVRQGAAEQGGWADEVLDDRRWRVRVSARLYEVVGEEGREGLEELLRDGPRRARKMPAHLLASMALAQRRIAEDPELRQAWAEAP
jgi:hypothetical protein